MHYLHLCFISVFEKPPSPAIIKSIISVFEPETTDSPQEEEYKKVFEEYKRLVSKIQILYKFASAVLFIKRWVVTFEEEFVHFFLFKEENYIWIKNWVSILAFGFFFLNIGDKTSRNLIFFIIGILKSHYWNSSPDPRLISCSNLLWKISESRKNNSRKHVHLIHVTWKVTCIRRFLNRYDFFFSYYFESQYDFLRFY